MKNDLLRRLETKAELKYAALYQAKMRMTLQLAQDAAMIAANEVLQMGREGRRSLRWRLLMLSTTSAR